MDLRLADARGKLDLIEAQQEPQCWRSFIGGTGHPIVAKPDLYVRVALPGSAREYRAMIELDLATEGPSTIRGKAERYLSHLRAGIELRDHGVHPRVIWAVPDDRRAAQITEVIERMRSNGGLFAVCLAKDLLTFLASEARS